MVIAVRLTAADIGNVHAGYFCHFTRNGRMQFNTDNEHCIDPFYSQPAALAFTQNKTAFTEVRNAATVAILYSPIAIARALV